MADMIVSASITRSEPGTGTGLALPLSSYSPSVIFWHSMPATLPFFRYDL